MVYYLQYLTNHLCEDLIHTAVTRMLCEWFIEILSMQSVMLLA